MRVGGLYVKIKTLMGLCAVITGVVSPLFVRGTVQANGGYPWSNAVCVATGKTTGACPGYEWRVGSAVRNSATGLYYYRNCTDYAAWKLLSFGVALSKVSGLGNAGMWDDNAPKKGLRVSTIPVAGAVAVNNVGLGHVAVVESVNGMNITISEYNGSGTGEYRVRSGTPSQLGFTSFVDFGVSIGKGGDSSNGRYQSSYLAVAHNNDGRLSIFAVGTDNAIYVNTQQAVNSDNWQGWYQLPAYAKSVSATTMADGRMAVFYVGRDSAVWYRLQSAVNAKTWSPEYRIAANVAGPISAVRAGDGRIAIFTVGTDNNLYNIYSTNERVTGWSGWQGVPAYAKSVTAVNAVGNIEVFHIGGDDAVWYRREQGWGSRSWSAEYRINANVSGYISGAPSMSGYARVFSTGKDAQVYINQQTQQSPDKWEGWYGVPAYSHSIAAIRNYDGNMQYFIIGGDGAIWYRKQSAWNTKVWGAEHRIAANVMK